MICKGNENIKVLYFIFRVFEDMALRRIFGSKRDEVRGVWIRLNKEELNGLYFSPNIIRVIKSRGMR